MDKFKNKYRIPSARLLNWDYGSNGAYFITICTKGREHFFGEISNVVIPNMQLNTVGYLAEQYWLAIPAHFPFVELGNFVVMPNHIHGILIVDKIGNGGDINDTNDTVAFVETLHATSLPPNVLPENDEPENIQPENTKPRNADPNNTTNTNKQMAYISPKSGSVSTIIRSYKSAVTKNARAIHVDFDLQTRFHDHIIRNADSFETIQDYISNNPQNWRDDKFYSA